MRVIVTRPARAGRRRGSSELRARGVDARGAAADRDRRRSPTRGRCAQPGRAGRASPGGVRQPQRGRSTSSPRGPPGAPGRPASLAGSHRAGHVAGAARGRRAARRRSSSRRPTPRSSIPKRCGRGCAAATGAAPRVLVVRGDGGRDWLAERCATRAREVDVRRRLPALGAAARRAARERCSTPRWPRRRATAGSSAAPRRSTNLRALAPRRRLVAAAASRASPRIARIARSGRGRSRLRRRRRVPAAGAAAASRLRYNRSDRDRRSCIASTVAADRRRAPAVRMRRRRVRAARGAGCAPRRGCWLVARARRASRWCWPGTPQQRVHERWSRSWCGASRTAPRRRPRRACWPSRRRRRARDAAAKVALLEARVAEVALQRAPARGADPVAVALARREPARPTSKRRSASALQQSRDHRQRRAAGGRAEAGRRAAGAQQPAAPRSACGAPIARDLDRVARRQRGRHRRRWRSSSTRRCAWSTSCRCCRARARVGAQRPARGARRRRRRPRLRRRPAGAAGDWRRRLGSAWAR